MVSFWWKKAQTYFQRWWCLEHSLLDKYQMTKIYGILKGDKFIAKIDFRAFEIPFLSS